MDIGLSNIPDPWSRSRSGKQDAGDQVYRASGTFKALLRGMVESPAGSEAGAMRYNVSGLGKTFAKAFSEMPIVAPVACNNGELRPIETAHGAALQPMPTDESIRSAKQQFSPIEAKIEQSFLIPNSTIKIAADGRDIARRGVAGPNPLLLPSSNTTRLPLRPANSAQNLVEKTPSQVTGKPGAPSAQLSQTVVQLLSSDAGVRISVRLGKLSATENEQLRARIFAVAHEFGHPLAGLAIITSKRG